jgi:polyhydroxyalkanoate synthase
MRRAGVPVELVSGLAAASRPFASPLVPGGFLTEGVGFGHIALGTADLERSDRFAREVLGLAQSDWIEADLGGLALTARFYHCNARHHTLALASLPIELPQTLHHVMLETVSQDNVGKAFDRAFGAGVPIANALGKHENDQMFSFYAVTPAGFQIEVGYGARTIEEPWTDDRRYDRISEWGHQPLQSPLHRCAPMNEIAFERDDPPVLGANPFVGLTREQVAASLGRVGQRVAVEPGLALAAAAEAAAELVRVGTGRSDVAPASGDRRFIDPAWQRNPLFHRLMQAYLVGNHAVHRVIDEVELDAKSRARAHFAASLVTEAVAPTNFALTNPDAIGKAFQTRGRSLVAGTRHLLRDLRHNGGMPSQVDTRPFEVGRNLAVTPGQVVHRTEVFELIQYDEATPKVHRRPLVVVPPQINKYYITDLAPGRSLVEGTVAAGIPYFAISWRNPTADQRDRNLDTYVAACLEAIVVACDITRTDDANVAGVCAGGVTLAALLGHLAATGEASRVRSATFFVAGLDTSAETTATSLLSRRAVEAARSRSLRAGVLPGEDMARVFAWLRPNDLVWNYWVNNYLLGENPPAFDILYWNADTTRLPAALHSDFLDLYLTNGLAEADLEVLGTPIDLAKVECDSFVVAGATDHIIPWDGAYRTTQMLGGASRFVLSSGGHIQAIINPPDNPKASYLTSDARAPTAQDWRASATQVPGSWWPLWHGWLRERSGPTRARRTRGGSAAHRPVEPAPGRYVRL